MEEVIAFDRELFLILNRTNHPLFDQIMYWASNKFFWIPLYVIMASIVIKIHRGRSLLIFAVLVILILLVDQTTSSLAKPFFGRLRPCHDPYLSGLVHLVSACGGKFGFVSGHAANSFALATFFWLLFGRIYLVVFITWAGLISYSRIYLGVHFPFDVLAGALFGTASGWAVYQIYLVIYQRIFSPL